MDAGGPRGMKFVLQNATDLGKRISLIMSEDGAAKMKPQYLKTYRSNLEDFDRRLQCLIHFTAGKPPRAEESIRISVTNTLIINRSWNIQRDIQRQKNLTNQIQGLLTTYSRYHRIVHLEAL